QGVLPLVPYGPEVARTKEGGNVAIQVSIEMHAEAGEAKVLRQVGAYQTARAVIEHRGIVGQFLRLSIHHLVYPYRALVVLAQMKEPHLETPAVSDPQ